MNSPSEALADPSLGNDADAAKDLLFRGADVSWDFHAAAQNAASGGHAAVLKLVLAADLEFHETKSDAMRAAARARQFEISELLIFNTADMMNTNPQRRALHQDFVNARQAQDRPAADRALDQIVTLMFPRPPAVA